MVVDAVVIGAGPNGLVSAIVLADAGWDVLVLEATDHFGGAVWSTESGGWISDRCSSSYPLGVASPVIRALDLEQFGLKWAHAPAALTHILSPEDESGATIADEPETTAAHLAEEHTADGEAWLRLCDEYRRIREPLLNALLTAWPPIRSGLQLARALGSIGELAKFARFLALPAHRMGHELFQGSRGRALLAGNAMHADAPLTASVSGTMGWLLAMLAQDVGFPCAAGGSGSLAAALVARAEHAGAVLRSGEPVTDIVVSGNRATGVRTAGGEQIDVRRAVVAGVSAPMLYGELLPDATGFLDTYEWDLPTVKVNYRLSGPVPWTAIPARSSGVVHLGGDADGLVHTCADLDTGKLPSAPFLLVGQTTTSDPSRSPAGTEALWAYSHLPRGMYDDASADRLAGRMDRVLERHAPGFGDLIIDREVQRPSDFTGGNASLGFGALNGGTAQLHQQLVFRPMAGLGGPRTVVSGLYLGSSAIHPGGGVHGACGWLAARAALSDGPLRRRITSGLLRRLHY